jgi:hypothetical protein
MRQKIADTGISVLSASDQHVIDSSAATTAQQGNATKKQ